MPTTINDTLGNSYHLYQLGDMSAPEPSDSQTFTVLENELSEGYRSRALFGSPTGIKSWTLPLNTLAGSTVIPAAVTDPYAATVSRENYIRNLYKYNKTTGVPFAYADPNNNGQYYLVDIVEDELMLKKIKGANIYSAELTFRQRRINGVTIFDPLKIYPPITDWFNETSHGAGVWNSLTTGSLTAAGDVVFSANPINGKNTVRLNASAATGSLTFGGVFEGSPVFDLFIVMKMREATFTNAAGILSNGTDYIRGTSAGTKFQNLSLANLRYYKNNVEYAVTDQQAPMNVAGVVHLQIPYNGLGGSPIDPTDVRWGRSTGSLFAKVDLCEIMAFSTLGVPEVHARELTEFLMVKWGIG